MQNTDNVRLSDGLEKKRSGFSTQMIFKICFGDVKANHCKKHGGIATTRFTRRSFRVAWNTKAWSKIVCESVILQEMPMNLIRNINGRYRNMHVRQNLGL